MSADPETQPRGHWRGPVQLHGNGRFVVSKQDCVSAYIKTHEQGGLKAKVEAAADLLAQCGVCIVFFCQNFEISHLGEGRELMDHYHPARRAANHARSAEVRRRLPGEEFRLALAHGRAAGLWRFDAR